MEFKPSIRTELVKFLLFLTLTFLFYFISIYIELPEYIYFLYKELKLNYILFGFLFINIINLLQLLNSMFTKLINSYKIEESTKTLFYINGFIFKERETIDIKEIRKILVFKPSFFQLITNIRTIGIEADGVEGWDVILYNISSWYKIEKYIMRVKNT